jgi:hypothetical protein
MPFFSITNKAPGRQQFCIFSSLSARWDIINRQQIFKNRESMERKDQMLY